MEKYKMEQLIYNLSDNDDDARRIALAAIIKKEYHAYNVAIPD